MPPFDIGVWIDVTQKSKDRHLKNRLTLGISLVSHLGRNKNS